ncbi:pimeloyl-ACP methyl ester carboxylesterase [Nocardia fluminea]|uniref:Pimeloyl-ACP methyl ester carboxylesterase n=1 Tax=Nocardia fluminea TaxID=134984 RepID=A0A2N3VJN9_9NOCA|nr:pimeloyl-ACP methyl ester carboxylesterase [Nocardia fluminea]
MTRWTVRTDGATIAVFEYGNPDAENTVLLVHGYPDDHRMFLSMIDALGDRVRIIAYDTRGGGATVVDDRDSLRSFTLPRLAGDVFAVVDSIPGPRTPIHVFAHDWGSVQMWEAMSAPRAASTFASYTSVSGPSLDHLRQLARTRAVRLSRWPSVISQVARSWYIWGFHVPVLSRHIPRVLSTAGYYKDAPRPSPDNERRGIALYRANVIDRLVGGPPANCVVPTTIVAPLRDRFLAPDLNDSVHEWVSDVAVIAVDAGHWWPYSHPAAAAQLLLSRW